MLDRAFWAGRRVLITGHTGFKGSWLTLLLKKLGAEIAGLALPPDATPNLFELAAVADGIDHRVGDITSLPAVEAAFAAHRPEIVLHLAAQSLVQESYRDPVGTYATNVLGTVHVLDTVRRCPSVRAVVVVSSDKCYDNREWVWAYRETDRLGGHDPYSNSKACSELVTDAYRRSFFHASSVQAPQTGIATARAGNVIGGGDWASDRLVPDLLRAFEKGEPAIVRRPHAVRPWQHVLVPLAGYLLLAEQLFHSPQRYSGAWNFGPLTDDMRPVEQIAAALSAALGEDASFEVHAEAGAPHEAGLLLLDADKARRELRWNSALDLDEALAWVAQWHRERAAGRGVREITLDQIERYEERFRSTAAPAAASESR